MKELRGLLSGLSAAKFADLNLREEESGEPIPSATKCKGCGHMIIWLTSNRSAKKIPVNALHVAPRVTHFDPFGHVAHWDQCKVNVKNGNIIP